MSNDVAEKILSELQSLRQEVSFLMPIESLEEYQNPEEITDALTAARVEMAE